MNRNNYNQKNHKKEMDSLNQIMRLLKEKRYILRSVTVTEEMMSQGLDLRVTIYMRPNEKD